jgi:hypothetical protein
MTYFNFSDKNIKIYMSNDLKIFPIAFRGASYTFPIVVNPHVVEGKQHSRFHLGLAPRIFPGMSLRKKTQ